MAKHRRNIHVTPEARAILAGKTWGDKLLRDEKNRVMGILANAITALRSAPEWVGVLAHDEFALRITTTRETPWGRVDKWSEHEDRLLADWLQHHGIIVSDGEAAKAAETVARDRPYHSVRSSRCAVVGRKPRLDGWLTKYLGAHDSPLTQAFGAKWMISAVARIYRPGCKADSCLIAEGRQGACKSTAFRILGGPWFTDDVADLGSKDSALATIGVWIIELPELDAMSRPELSRHQGLHEPSGRSVSAALRKATDRIAAPMRVRRDRESQRILARRNGGTAVLALRHRPYQPGLPEPGSRSTLG